MEGNNRVREACTTNATALTTIKASIIGSVYLILILVSGGSAENRHTDGSASSTTANGEDSLVLEIQVPALAKGWIVDEQPSLQRRVVSFLPCHPTLNQNPHRPLVVE